MLNHGVKLNRVKFQVTEQDRVGFSGAGQAKPALRVEYSDRHGGGALGGLMRAAVAASDARQRIPRRRFPKQGAAR